MKFQQQDMTGKVCLITGETAGIGQDAALLLAKRGATIVGVGRNPKKNQNSTEMIKTETGNPNVEYLLTDLSSQKEIHSLAQQFKHKYDRLDVLINNAGTTFGERMESVDAGTPVTDDYPARGNEFNGTIKWVQIDLEPDDHSHTLDTDHMAHVRIIKQ
jgi:NAD(P)-dependent dehydrogenase (short-subunit alcohol dehydrogenase family)